MQQEEFDLEVADHSGELDLLVVDFCDQLLLQVFIFCRNCCTLLLLVLCSSFVILHLI